MTTTMAKAPLPPGLDRKMLLGLFEEMVKLRRFELAAQEKCKTGEIKFVHLYVGEEATAVGVCAHLNPTDWITSTHRGHGHALAKGLDPRVLMAELYGKATGCCAGRGGSMHLYAPAIGLFGTNGIVGGGNPSAGGRRHGRDGAQERAGHRRLLRRWRLQPRLLPRIDQFRGDPARAGSLRLREQSVRHGDAPDGRDPQHRHFEQGGGIRHSRRGRGWKRRDGHVAGFETGGRPRARRPRARRSSRRAPTALSGITRATRWSACTARRRRSTCGRSATQFSPSADG